MGSKKVPSSSSELCDNSDFQPGTVFQIPAAGGAPSNNASLNPEAEKLVKLLTEQILASLK